MIRFTSRLTPREFFPLMLAGLLAPSVLVLLTLLVLLAAGYVFWSFLPTCGGVGAAAVFAAVTAVVVLLFVVVLVVLAAGVQVFLGKNRNLYVPVEVSADAGGLTTRSDLGEGTMRWSGFVRVRRVRSYVLLYQTSRTFFALGGPDVPAETLHAFETLAREQASR